MTIKEFALDAMWLMLAIIFIMITINILATPLINLLKRNKDTKNK